VQNCSCKLLKSEFADKEALKMASSGILRRVALVGTHSHCISSQGDRLLVTANVAPTSPILTRVTWRNIPEDGILHSHRRENFKSYTALIGWAL
jgi:hypothetical protein